MRKSDKELEAAVGTAEGASVGGQEEEEMDQDEEGARASRAREDGDEALAVASAAGRRRSD